jgi:PBP1b-binding outer membrane lipoprotein LpoB
MKRILAAVLGLSLVTAGCSDPIAPAAPTPVAATINETFSDTLLVLGSNTHPFSVQQVGGLKVNISNITPGAAVE